jgi:hypothetical protein
MVRTSSYVFAVFSLILLTVASCGKYESQSAFDNNCSGSGGFYESGRCADYVDGP